MTLRNASLIFSALVAAVAFPSLFLVARPLAEDRHVRASRRNV
jgi:hypothetical protein